jgi:hypothetical protein
MRDRLAQVHTHKQNLESHSSQDVFLILGVCCTGNGLGTHPLFLCSLLHGPGHRNETGLEPGEPPGLHNPTD